MSEEEEGGSSSLQVGGGGFFSKSASMFSTLKGLTVLSLFRDDEPPPLAEEDEEEVDEWEMKRQQELDELEKKIEVCTDVRQKRALLDLKALKSKGREERRQFWEDRQSKLKEEHLPIEADRSKKRSQMKEEADKQPIDPTSLLSEDMLEYRRQNESLLKLIGNRPPKELPPDMETGEDKYEPLSHAVVKSHRIDKKIANKALPKVVTNKGEIKNAPVRPYSKVVITSFSAGILPSYHEDILK